MKAVAYSIKPFEKEFLAKANQKKHEITLISNALSPDTALYAEGKDAVIVFPNDEVSGKVIKILAGFGIKYIITRSTGIDHIDKDAADLHGIQISNIPSYAPHAIAEHAVAMAFALNRQLLKADRQSRHFNFRNDELIGFNFYGKKVGIIGLGHTGQAVAKIYNGMGCEVIANDPVFPDHAENVKQVTLDKLLAESDVISMHLPLTAKNRHIIQKDTLAKMKDGVMLINISRGALINSIDILEAVENGKIGYLGLDVYEYEKGLFFEDHGNDQIKDPLLEKLIKYPNVLVTPHQAYLTKEALQQIANQTIKKLDMWQMNKPDEPAIEIIEERKKKL